jgi:DNA-binding YbaB/EbfC family protein
MDINQLMAGMGPIQEAMAKADAERKEAKLEGSAGGGAVKVVLTGDLTVEAITISPAAAVASEDDVTMLEDLISAAVGDALAAYKRRFGASPDEMLQKSLAGSNLGPLLGGLMGGMQ